MKWYYKMKIGSKIMLGISVACLMIIAVGAVNFFIDDQLITLIALAAAVVVTLVVGILIARSLSKRAHDVQGTISKMCFGQFDIRQDKYHYQNSPKTKDEIINVAKGIDQFLNYLHTFIISTINNIADGKIDEVTKLVDTIAATQPGMDTAAILEADHLTNPLLRTVKTINDLLESTLTLKNDVEVGNMRSRIDVTLFKGQWCSIAEGINQIIFQISAPISEASMVMSQMAEGNLQTRVVGDFKGDHDRFIKTPLNKSLDSIWAYVNEISDVLTAMANSNLQQEIVNDYPGDFAPMKDALNLIIQSFNKVLNEMNVSADQVTAGARQVSDGSQALSMGTTVQASSIEELNASLIEIASRTKQNAINANEASELAVETRGNAIAGNARMKDLQKAMEEINVSSNSISKIIKVIDDIAFQTNILALNAAVEAARAGQHGKGFAVVAEEVRNLAARSASAAKETTGLIEGSIRKVELGTKIANETATALDKIVNDISKSANLVSEIATASNDQATGIAQINLGVEQVSQVVQANSATAEESAAASEELSGQAEMLKEMIAQFKLRESENGVSKGSYTRKSSFESKGSTSAKIEKRDDHHSNQSREELVIEYQKRMAAKDAQKAEAQGKPPEPSKHPDPAKPPESAKTPEPSHAHTAPKKPKIALSDNEFDKF